MAQKSVALVTGASSGMGKEFAKALLQEGMTVYAAARRLEQMDDLKQLGIKPLRMDISKEEDIKAVVATIEQEQGGVDVLINNAGFGVYGSVEETTLADARYQFEVNLFGLARLTQLVLPSMRAKKTGKIINISSIGGKIYTPLGSWYYATKHALEGWSDCLRLEVQPFGIDVVIIEPGLIKTEFGEVMLEPMLKRSGTGPYADLANRLAKAQKTQYENSGASDPQVITNLVVKAVRSNNPNTRYAAGKYATLTLFMRRWCSDRMFDKMIMRMVK
ncbi:MAG: oxidoreductase [Myxococcota bacterium]